MEQYNLTGLMLPQGDNPYSYNALELLQANASKELVMGLIFLTLLIIIICVLGIALGKWANKELTEMGFYNGFIMDLAFGVIWAFSVFIVVYLYAII